MSNPFFDHPILNSPYEYPSRHWELDEAGQPTQKIIERRRTAKFITPIPKPKKRKAAGHAPHDRGFLFDDGGRIAARSKAPSFVEHKSRLALLAQSQSVAGYAGDSPASSALAASRQRCPSILLPGGGGGNRDLAHRSRTSIQEWQAHARPSRGSQQRRQPRTLRLALKLATGAGKTTVMAMLIAWQTINAVRHPGSKNFTRGFLVSPPA